MTNISSPTESLALGTKALFVLLYSKVILKKIKQAKRLVLFFHIFCKVFCPRCAQI